MPYVALVGLLLGGALHLHEPLYGRWVWLATLPDRNEAEYLLASEEETLQGPALGDPDYWPAAVSRPPALCREHYLQLSADERLDYAHRGDDFERML